MSRVKEFDVVLQDPITTHSKGNEVEVEAILVKSPTAKQRKNAYTLKQMFVRTMMKSQENLSAEQIEAAKKSSGDKSTEIEAEEIVMMMMSSEEDFNKFNETFVELLTSGCAEVQGDKFTKHHYDQLSIEDAENILGEYLKNFLVSSLLQ